jgi:hypothetical protein
MKGNERKMDADKVTSTAAIAAVASEASVLTDIVAKEKAEILVDPWKAKAFEEMAAYVNQAENSPAEDFHIFYLNALRTTVAVRTFWDGKGKKHETQGYARLNPTDEYNRIIGRYLAVKRARRGSIPKTIAPYI